MFSSACSGVIARGFARFAAAGAGASRFGNDPGADVDRAAGAGLACFAADEDGSDVEPVAVGTGATALGVGSAGDSTRVWLRPAAAARLPVAGAFVAGSDFAAVFGATDCFATAFFATTFLATVFFAMLFFATEVAGAIRLATVFFAAVLPDAAFLTATCLAAAVFATPARAVDFFAVVFFPAVFIAVLFFAATFLAGALLAAADAPAGFAVFFFAAGFPEVFFAACLAARLIAMSSPLDWIGCRIDIARTVPAHGHLDSIGIIHAG